VVVSVGLTLVEPLADLGLNVPDVMAILAAPVVSHRLLLAPEFVLVGSAVEELIVRAEPGPENEFDGATELQSAGPTQANRINAIAQRFSPEAWSQRELIPILQDVPAESMRSPLVVIDDSILANANIFAEPASEAFVSGPDVGHAQNGRKTKGIELFEASLGALDRS
jgi:hypothetical protein